MYTVFCVWKRDRSVSERQDPDSPASANRPAGAPVSPYQASPAGNYTLSTVHQVNKYSLQHLILTTLCAVCCVTGLQLSSGPDRGRQVTAKLYTTLRGFCPVHRAKLTFRLSSLQFSFYLSSPDLLKSTLGQSRAVGGPPGRADSLPALRCPGK